MTAKFHYVRDSERGTESLVISGEVVRTVAKSHPNFIKIRDYCFAQTDAGEEIDIDHILELTDVQAQINNAFLRITDRVSFRGGKLLWDGEETEGALADHIVRMVQNRDDNYVAFAKFLENLAQNPSVESRQALFQWIADRDFTITEDGCFVGYKGVNRDYSSWHAGYGIVNGVEYESAHLDNSPGNVIEIPRGKVNPDRNAGCSVGLHVGTASYATSYGPRQVIVSVNPRDVVMVPHEHGYQKMRVCKYVVLADHEDRGVELKTTTYNGAHRAEDVVPVPTMDRCEECDCLLNSDGVCDCESCLPTCDSCYSARADYDGVICVECAEEEAEEEDDDPNLCTECGAAISDDEDYCNGCQEEPEPEPTATCQYCGGVLDNNGVCSGDIWRRVQKGD